MDRRNQGPRGAGRAAEDGAPAPMVRGRDGGEQGDGGTRYGFVYVDQKGFEQHKPSSFAALASAFREYQEG